MFFLKKIINNHKTQSLISFQTEFALVFNRPRAPFNARRIVAMATEPGARRDDDDEDDNVDDVDDVD